MKTIDLSSDRTTLTELLRQASQDDLRVRAADGSEYVVLAIDDFAAEVARAGGNEQLLSLLRQRANEAERSDLASVRERLGL